MDIKNKFYKDKWFLDSLVENIPASITVTDLDFKIVYINKAAEKAFGYSKEEVIGKDPIIFNAEPGSREIQNDINKVVKSGKVWKNRILNRRKNGDLFVIDIEVSSLKGENGKIAGYIGFQKDVTEIETALQDVIISENRYQTTFESAPICIIMLNASGDMVNCNKRIKDILGCSREDVIGKNCHLWIHPDYHDQCDEDLNKLISGELETSYSEFTFIKKNDDLIEVGVNSTYINDHDGNFIHTICFVRDITERKKSELSLIEIASELKRSNKELEEFAYVASHDLQEPLRVVASYCQLVKEKHYDCLDVDGRKHIDYALSSALRMRTLIKELLDFSRVGRKDKPFEYVPMKEILVEAIADYQISISEKNAKIIVDESLPIIFAIRFRIKQLVANLISNALKFHSDRDPVIHIGCCDEGSFWLFYVKDNGIGIDSQYFERIFGIFKRLYSRDEYSGTGIGLAICRRIVETHGGKIWVDSEENEGTCMYFTIAKHMEFPEVIVL